MAWSAEKQLAYMRRYYAANKASINAKNLAYHEKHKEHLLAKAREYYRENREKINAAKREKRKLNPKVYNDRARVSRFGLAPGEFDAMAIAQNHCCDLCGDHRQLVVDHNHKTGKVRALLCAPCNTALGLLKEDTKRIWRAMEYVVAHREAA